MQTLEIISINLWSILISLANLVILFLIVKKFLYKPVKNVLAERKSEIDNKYQEAEDAKLSAQKDKEDWENKMQSANQQANDIIKNAEQSAEVRKDAIIEDANQKARTIIRRAENEAELEKQKAKESIKKEITDVSTALAEKMLEREIKEEDHKALIDTFLNEVGDE